MNRLDNERDQFIKSIEQYKLHFEKIEKFSDMNTVNEFSHDSLELKDKLDKAFEQVKIFNDREAIFELNKSEYGELDELNTKFKPFYELINIAYEVEYSLTQWTRDPLIKQNAGEMTSNINQWHQGCFQLYKKMNEDYPHTAAVAQVLREKIEDFMQHLPLIKCLTSEAITEEDWGFIKQAIKQENFEKDEVTVEKMIALDLHQYLEEIEEITMKAEKKLSLFKKLKQMKEEMKQFTIS
mmetsp:Transcript_43579/g.42087  ORF Transcript_43579/g.42087 Transcript_43579/m.42087 type:complete len:239 (-) Transcript_43579:1749-2465(-)